jgi:hypothetical protein
MIDLTKKAKISLEKKGLSAEQAEIVFVLDYSASMNGLFRKGTVQKVTERLLAIGMNMDRNKRIRVFLFGDKAYELPHPATERNIDGYVKREVTSKYEFESSTEYAPVMKLVARSTLNLQETNHRVTEVVQAKGLFRRLFRKKEVIKNKETEGFSYTAQHPVFVFFVTDGDNFDKAATEELIKKYAELPIFWQFIGVGNSSFSFLEKLDRIDGRVVDNANFFQVNDIDKISDEELYNRLLNEYPKWLQEVRRKGILK